MHNSIYRRIAYRSINANRTKNILVEILIFLSSLVLSFCLILIFNGYIDLNYDYAEAFHESIGAILGIVIIIVCTAGAAIKNILNVSLIQRVEEYKQLIIIGTTKKQLKKIMRKERNILCIRSVPLGALTGLFLNICAPLQVNVILSISLMLISMILIWTMVSLVLEGIINKVTNIVPLENGFVDKRVQINLRKCKKITPLNLCLRYIHLDLKKFVHTLAALTLSGILLLLVFTVMSSINIENIAGQDFLENSRFYIELNSSLLKKEENYSYDSLKRNSPLDEGLEKDILNIPGVASLYKLKFLRCKLFNDNGEINSIDTIENIVDCNTFSNMVTEGNLPYYNGQWKMIPIIINKKAYAYEKADINLELGDLLSAKIDTGNDVVSVDFVVDGYIEEKDIATVIFTDGKYIDELADIKSDFRWYICVKNHTEDNVKVLLEEIIRDKNTLTLVSLKDTIQAYKQYFKSALVVIITLISVVGSFAFVNLVNTCVTNIIMRKGDYGILEAVGMTQKQLKCVCICENGLYLWGSFLGSLIIGIPLGKILCVYLPKIAGINYIEYHFPFQFIIVYAAFLIIVEIILLSYQSFTVSNNSTILRINQSR